MDTLSNLATAEKVLDKVEDYVPESQKDNFDKLKSKVEVEAGKSAIKSALSGGSDDSTSSNGLSQVTGLAEKYLGSSSSDDSKN